MLNGIAPIIIFNFKKLLPQLDISGIPLLANITDSVPLIPIPIILDERITGIYIDYENKNIDIDTIAQTLPNGKKPIVKQVGLDSTVTINMLANKNSIGLSVLIAMSDYIFSRVSSEEYTVSYLNNSVMIFGGLVSSFAVNQSRDNDLYDISMVISKSNGGSTVEEEQIADAPKQTAIVPQITDAVPLGS